MNGLSKKSQYTEGILRSIIKKEVNGHSCYLGYRGMWNLVPSKYNILVSRDLVMFVLKAIDPNAKKQRKSCKEKPARYLVKGGNDIMTC